MIAGACLLLRQGGVGATGGGEERPPCWAVQHRGIERTRAGAGLGIWRLSPPGIHTPPSHACAPCACIAVHASERSVANTPVLWLAPRCGDPCGCQAPPCRLGSEGDAERDAKMAGILVMRLLQAYHKEAGGQSQLVGWCQQGDPVWKGPSGQVGYMRCMHACA